MCASAHRYWTDAALIDVRMTDGDGLELVREIHDGGVGSPIPTLVLTAYMDTKVAARAMEYGARGHSPRWSRYRRPWRRSGG